MKLILSMLMLCGSLTHLDAQGFISSYRMFWTSRLITLSVTKPYSREPVHTELKVTAASSIPAYKPRMAQIDDLTLLVKKYKDSLGVDFDQSTTLYILRFMDQRTDVERTYMWNSHDRLYYEHFTYIDSLGRSRRKLIHKNVPKPELSSVYLIQNKEDTLQTLLEKRKLSSMNQLAQSHRIANGETCLGVICDKLGALYRFTPIELPAFEYSRVYRK